MMGEFLSRLSSRSRLAWIIALVVFVLGASIGGYLIYKKQIFAAVPATSCSVTLKSIVATKNTAAEYVYLLTPSDYEKAKIPGTAGIDASRKLIGSNSTLAIAVGSEFYPVGHSETGSIISSTPPKIICDGTKNFSIDANLQTKVFTLTSIPISSPQQISGTANSSSSCVQLKGVRLLIRVDGPTGPYQIGYSSDEAQYQTGSILAPSDYIGAQKLAIGECSSTGAPSAQASTAPTTNPPAGSNSSSLSGDTCLITNQGLTEIMLAGTKNSENAGMTITWSNHPEIAGYGVGQQVVFEQIAPNWKTMDDCKKAAGVTPVSIAVAESSGKARFSFVTDKGMPVKNAAIGTKNDKGDIVILISATGGDTTIDYVKPKDGTTVQIYGFKDIKDGSNNKRVFSSCNPVEVNKTSTSFACKFSNYPQGFETADGCYTEGCQRGLTTYTSSNLPKGESKIYFRAVRYSYAGAGYEQFSQFAPVGGARFVINFKPAVKTTGLFQSSKAFAQKDTGNEGQAVGPIDNWTGYDCYSSDLYSKPILRNSQPIRGSSSVIDKNNCLVVANDPDNNCKSTKFGRVTAGETSTDGPYFLVAKPSGGTRYPSAGSVNPTASDITPCATNTTQTIDDQDIPANNSTASGSTTCTANIDGTTWTFTKGTGMNWSTSVIPSNVPESLNPCPTRKPCTEISSGTGKIHNLSSWVKADGTVINPGEAIDPKIIECTETAASGATAAAATVASGIPTAIAPWNKDRVRPYTQRMFARGLEWGRNIINYSQTYTINGTIPDNGLESGIVLAALPAGDYKISIYKSGYNRSTFTFELRDKEELDLGGLPIAPTGTVLEAPSINASQVDGKNYQKILLDQFQLDKDRVNSLIFATRETETLVYQPSTPSVGWLPLGKTFPARTVYTDEAPGIPIFTDGTSSNPTPWTGVASGSPGQPVQNCASIFKADGLNDTQSLIAAAGLIGNSVFKDQTAKDVSLAVAMLAMASGSSSMDVVCNGVGAASQYATSPQCTCPNGAPSCTGLPAYCYTGQPIWGTILNSIGSIFKK